MILIAAFAIYVIVVQRVRITRNLTLVGRRARNFGITLLVIFLPLAVVIDAFLSGVLPEPVLANPFAGRLIALSIFSVVIVLLARAFREPTAATVSADDRAESTNSSVSCGQRVRVSMASHWAKLAKGVIDRPPQAVVALSGDWSECSRRVTARNGDTQFWWVRFDVPQVDADGDGPYEGGEIDGRYIEAIENGDA